MRVIWRYLKQHIALDFHAFHYGFVALFLTICIYFNFKFDFEDSFLDNQEGVYRFLYYFLTNLTAYFVPVVSYSIFRQRLQLFTSTEFIVKSILAIALLSFDRCAFFIHDVTDFFFHNRVQFWIGKVFNNLMGIFTMILPFFLAYFWYDRSQKHCYGLTPKRFDTKPYFTMLAIMLPLIIVASFSPGFLDQYPMYYSTKAHLHLGVQEWVTVIIYEIAYGLNFVSIEFFFRGFLVIGMMSILGRAAIVPMASIYCFLHFGKPMGEAISSIVGGYILGVVAYQTRGIWGGVIVHVGIAWTMELAAFLQKTFSNE